MTFLRPHYLSLLLLIDVAARAEDSFLSNTLLKKDQVQNVLEHEPAKVPSCQNAVVSARTTT